MGLGPWEGRRPVGLLPMAAVASSPTVLAPRPLPRPWEGLGPLYTHFQHHHQEKLHFCPDPSYHMAENISQHNSRKFLKFYENIDLQIPEAQQTLSNINKKRLT